MARSRGNQTAPSPSRNGNGNGRTAEEKGNPPVWSRKAYTGSANIEVAIFERIVNPGEDGEFLAYAVSCKRTWKQDDEYKSTTFFRSDDVPVLISLMLQAHAYICEVQAKR